LQFTKVNVCASDRQQICHCRIPPVIGYRRFQKVGDKPVSDSAECSHGRLNLVGPVFGDACEMALECGICVCKPIEDDQVFVEELTVSEEQAVAEAHQETVEVRERL
jgi:hypothetical protein